MSDVQDKDISVVPQPSFQPRKSPKIIGVLQQMMKTENTQLMMMDEANNPLAPSVTSTPLVVPPEKQFFPTFPALIPAQIPAQTQPEEPDVQWFLYPLICIIIIGCLVPFALMFNTSKDDVWITEIVEINNNTLTAPLPSEFTAPTLATPLNTSETITFDE